MNTTTALVIAFAVAALLMLLFGGGMETGTMFGRGMAGSGSMGEISSVWLPTLLVVALDIVLFSVIFGKEYGTQSRCRTPWQALPVSSRR